MNRIVFVPSTTRSYRWFGYLDLSKGAGTANTALVYHARRLLALHEGDMPYAIHILCK